MSVVFEGTPGDNANYDSSGNDIIHGCKGHDYVRFNGGNDTVLYARGDGSDLVDGSQGTAGETNVAQSRVTRLSSNLRARCC